MEFPRTTSGTGVRICHKGHTLFFQDNPIQFIVYHAGTKTAPPEEAVHVAPYSQVKHVPEGILACGILHTTEGIAVHFSDLYQTSNGIFTLHRKVKVTAAPPNGTEMGFATAYAILPYAPCTPDAYEYFIPSILYRDTEGMHPHAIAADLQVNRMYVKETRTGMPMAMLRDMRNGIQLSLLHHPDIETAGYPNGGQPGIIDNAIRMVEGCSCESGCPACVGDYNLDKKMVLWGLKNLLQESEPPEFEGKQIEESHPFIQKGFSFYRLPLEWSAFCDSVVRNGESGGAFLRTVEQVEVNGHRLILTVGSSFYEGWLMDPDNMRGLENTVRYHAVCPADMRIEVRVAENRERTDKIKGKLRRRYEDKLS